MNTELVFAGIAVVVVMSKVIVLKSIVDSTAYHFKDYVSMIVA
jgi:hypothetical protein